MITRMVTDRRLRARPVRKLILPSPLTNADHISSFLVNQAPRQSSKGVSWVVYGGLFSEGTGGGSWKNRGWNLQKIELSGLRHSLSAAANVELGEDVVDVLFDGACGEDELFRDVPVGEAGGD